MNAPPCNCGQTLHWKNRSKELAEMVLDFTCRNPKDPYTVRAGEILTEIESEES